MGVAIRRAVSGDLDAVAQLCHALWPDATAEEHARDILPALAAESLGLLPAVVFVAEDSRGALAGFV